MKREHVLSQFTEENSLLHYTVASGDVESVEHVLSLGAEVNCSAATSHTPLIIAVLNRFVLKMLVNTKHTEKNVAINFLIRSAVLQTGNIIYLLNIEHD